MRLRSLLYIAALFVVPATARADIDSKLASYEQEARAIGRDLPKPNTITGAPPRRLIDAEVAFSLGDYEASSLALFDLASKPGPEQETALFYLAESLYLKGDKGAARAYYVQVAATKSVKYYEPALIRLIEIAIWQNDPTDVDGHLSALAISQNPEAPYAKGKWLFSQGKYDEAIASLSAVPAGSSHDFQAQYYKATSLVAKKELGQATNVFTDLIARKPVTMNDRRVIELSQMALGRLYYEQDQPAKSIDSYLLVDRKSDLFADALYEVAWVYVKGKQYDKALRALELLHLSEPDSPKGATVRILEGNLRIRKAQKIRLNQITGALDAAKEGDPAVEYDKARAVFAETHDVYMPSYLALAQMVDAGGDPGQWISQVAGRQGHVFMATQPLPEAATQYLREEPEVQRVVTVEQDLGDIESNLKQAEATVSRLEGVLAANDKTAVYPALQSRRTRIGEIQDDLIKMRADLAEQQAKLVAPPPETAQRQQLVQAYLAAPSPEKAWSQSVDQAYAGYSTIDDNAFEVSAALGSTQAMAVAIRKYTSDMAVAGTPVSIAGQANEELATAAKEAAAIETELEQIQRELQLGRDLAGVGDESVAKARSLRLQVKAALDAEHRNLANAASSSRDRSKSQKLAALGDRALRLSDLLAQTEGQIDTIAGQGIEQAKIVIAQERANIVQYKAELDALETESKSLGGTVLGKSFANVKARFYDIVIRTDVGTVDVSWSQKEDADDDFKRLNLARQRDLKQLRDEFKGVLDEGQPKKPAPRAPAPGPDTGPAGSPDRGAGPGRVAPGAPATTPAPAPTVRPDNEQGKQPAGTTPKAGAK